MSLMTAILMLGAIQDAAALAKEAEAWSIEHLRGNYYLERARSGIAILKDRLKGPIPAEARAEAQEMTATLKELEAIFAQHDPQKPSETALRLIRSSNRRVVEEGGKALRRGDFPEALVELKKTDPALARQVEDDQRRQANPRPAPAAETLRLDLIDLVKRVLGELKKTPEGVRHTGTLRAATNVDFGPNAKAWETWLAKNEAFLGVLPQFRNSTSGAGVLFVDEEAKAAGVPWTEWQVLGADARAARLKDKKVPEGWKRVQVILELDEDSGIAIADGLQPFGGEMDTSPASKQLVYWLLLHKRLVAEAAPGWGVRVRVTGGDRDHARKVATRCEKLGVEVRTAPDAR